MEWDDPRARYPNLWHGGMPAHVLATLRVAARLRLGDLVAVFHPASTRHEERSERFVGLSRVAGLRRADAAGFAWVDLETAHRFEPALDAGGAPRRVFLCCDPGWPADEVALFERVFRAALAAGWRPQPDELAPAQAPPAPLEDEPSPAAADDAPPGVESPAAEPRRAARPARMASPGAGRLFAGADLSGDMRDPRRATWLALVELDGDVLHVRRLDPTGRAGLQSLLRDPDPWLMRAEAIGLDFPFGVPQRFGERLLGGPFPGEGWWALARRLEKMTRPDYLTALKEFRDAEGELKRLTDERAAALSPLHRVNPDLGPMTYHGIRMIAADRSRFAIRPFEAAQGRLLLETYPGGVVRRLALSPAGQDGPRTATLLGRLAELERWPLIVESRLRERCLESREALDAVLAARSAAVAVLTGESERRPEELAPGEGARVGVEGWIFGLGEGP